MRRLIFELRWDPTLLEWVMISNVRELRPWRPKEGCPFCPGSPEVGSGDWDVLTLDNKYPMLVPNPPEVEVGKYPLVRAPSRGRCLVLIETPRHDLRDISELGVEGVSKVIEEVRRLTRECMDEGYAYLLWFRNRGEEIGVSLTHPHSQIYVTPFTPTKVFRELYGSWIYMRRYGRCLFCDIVETELSDGSRVLINEESVVAFVPFYAHWPFEVHIYPKRHVQLITDLSSDEVRGLAKALVKVLNALDKVFNKPMPYILVMHQAPLRGKYTHYHLHIEIYGMYRVSSRLKYAAGMEHGGGNFTYDTTPEYVAKVLRGLISNE